MLIERRLELFKLTTLYQLMQYLNEKDFSPFVSFVITGSNKTTT